MKSFSERPAVLTAPQMASVEPVEWRPEDARAVEEPVPGVEHWEREIEAAYERGRAEGFAQGVEEGRRQEAQRIAPAVAAVEAAAEAVRAGEAEWREALEQNLCALATAIARHVIGRELRTDADAIADLVRRALAEFPVDQPLRVRLNPRDLSTISAVSPVDGEAVAIAPGRDVRWAADPAIGPGGCVVEGRDRIVDGRVDRALERIYRSLADA